MIALYIFHAVLFVCLRVAQEVRRIRTQKVRQTLRWELKSPAILLRQRELVAMRRPILRILFEKFDTLRKGNMRIFAENKH